MATTLPRLGDLFREEDEDDEGGVLLFRYSEPESFEHEATVPCVALVSTRRRVIAIDVEHGELLVVSEEAYLARDFRVVERVPLASALYVP